MKTSSLFLHLETAQGKMQRKAMEGETIFGILVRCDAIAIEYQKLARAERKLHIRVLCRLDPRHLKFIAGMNLCRKCYGMETFCKCRGGFKPIKYYDAFVGQENRLLHEIMYEMMDDNRAGMSMPWADRVFYVKRIASVLGAMDEYDQWLEGPLPF